MPMKDTISRKCLIERPERAAKIATWKDARKIQE
jgi:hypothetical protein